jgi:hypothetical protein
MDDKFMKFWKKYGPFILFGTGITLFIRELGCRFYIHTSRNNVKKRK